MSVRDVHFSINIRNILMLFRRNEFAEAYEYVDWMYVKQYQRFIKSANIHKINNIQIGVFIQD